MQANPAQCTLCICGKGVQTNSVKCTISIKWIHKRCSGIRGDLSLLVDGFRCKRCDGRIQEADLAWGLVVDGETYGCVKSFSYLGDTFDGHDGCPCVRRSMIYGSETRPLLADLGLQYERADMQIIRWMCDVSMKDRRTSEELIMLVGVQPITTVIRSVFLDITYSSVLQICLPKIFSWR